jgi:hypothetical protein
MPRMHSAWPRNEARTQPPRQNRIGCSVVHAPLRVEHHCTIPPRLIGGDQAVEHVCPHTSVIDLIEDETFLPSCSLAPLREQRRQHRAPLLGQRVARCGAVALDQTPDHHVLRGRVGDGGLASLNCL